MPERFTLIRHGRTTWNVDGRWQGHANVGLNDEGLRQAEQLAAAFADTDATAIYSSDLSRARQTAEAIAYRANLPLLLDQRLREIDMGDWQGMNGSEVELWDGARLAAVRAGGIDVPRPGGESQRQVAERAIALLNDVLQARPDEHVLLVSHGGTIRILLNHLQLLDETHGHIGNTSRSAIRYHASDTRWQLDSYNVLDHLGQDP